MSDTYLELHNLEASLTEFAVARIVDTELQNSPECQLPDDLEVTLDLPNLAVTLPELACDYNIDLPLVPLPHFCSPSFTADVGFEGCEGTDIDVELGFSDDGNCNYSLGGMISVCATGPCPDGYSASGTITPSTNGTADYVQLYGSIALAQDGPCGFAISGDLTLEENIPNLEYVCKTQNFKLEFETEELAFEIPIIEDFKITIYPKLIFEEIERTACKTKYKITIDQWTAPVIENLEVKEITYCGLEGEETRKFLCLTE